MRASAVLTVVAALLTTILPAQDWDSHVVAEVKAAGYFRVESHEASDADVELTQQLLCAAIVRLRAMFGQERADRALRGIDCVVHLHGKPTADVTEACARLVTGMREEKYTASIAILAPSAFFAGYRDAVDWGPGSDHHAKVLAHEYSTILLDRIGAEKAAGWRFFSGPAWFVQGYEEYLGAASMVPSKRDEALAAYVRAQADPGRVLFHPRLAIQDPYVDGAAVLHFLHESFGGERVRAVLDAPQDTFDEALTAALGASPKELETRWKAWREEALARTEWRPALLAAKSPPEIVAAVVGQDLRDLPEDVRDTVVDALRTLAGKDEYWRQPHDGAPHRVYRVNSGVARWALVVSYPAFEVPGVSWMAVHLFDGEWKQTAVANYPTGYRISLFDVWQERVDSLPEPAIVVRLGTIGSFNNFTYRQRQYYAVRDGRVALVRVQEEGGQVTRGDFAAAHPWTGPRPQQRTVAQWVESLASADPADVLETLTWLAGIHLSADKERQPGVNEESVEDSRLWETVRDDPRVKERLVELAKSPNRWVREATASAATPAKER